MWKDEYEYVTEKDESVKSGDELMPGEEEYLEVGEISGGTNSQKPSIEQP